MIVREMLFRFGVSFEQKGADEANQTMARLATAGKTLLAAFAFQRVSGMVMGMVDAASAAQDQLNVLNQVFQGNAKSVYDWAESQADVLGRSKYSLIQYASAMGSVLVPMLNGNREKAAEMSQGIAQLSVDLGSFYHQADDETMARLRSGLLGSTEAVDQLGINLRQDALATHAASMGIKNFGSKTDEATKMAVRYSKILKDTKDKQGWAAKTGHEYDNQMRNLQETLKDLSITIGSKLMGPAEKIVSTFTKGSVALADMVKTSNAAEVALAGLAALFGLLALQWTLANIPLILLIGLLLALGLVLEDLYTGLEGGDSAIAEWFKDLAGEKEWEKVIKTWRANKAILMDIMEANWGAAAEKLFDVTNTQTTQTDREAMETSAANQRLRNNPWAPWWGAWNDQPGRTMDLPQYGTTSAAAKHANIAGPWAEGYSSGRIVININGNATPATARQVGEATRRALEEQNRNTYRTSGRFTKPGGLGMGVPPEGPIQ